MDFRTISNAKKMTDAATEWAHKEFARRDPHVSGKPVSKEYQRRVDNLNSVTERLENMKTRSLEQVSRLLDEKGSSYLIENYLDVLTQVDAKLSTIRKYEWYLHENRVSELR
tara:strand:+ start:29 stop:364 length:336 start_codon:yes stop_codon:yes gene_type:complete